MTGYKAKLYNLITLIKGNLVIPSEPSMSIAFDVSEELNLADKQI